MIFDSARQETAIFAIFWLISMWLNDFHSFNYYNNNDVIIVAARFIYIFNFFRSK